MQSDSVMLQFQPVLVKKNQLVELSGQGALMPSSHRMRPFVNSLWIEGSSISINQRGNCWPAIFVCLFVCLFVCFPLFFSSQKFTREFVTHSAHHISIRMSFHHRVSLAWLGSFRPFSQTACGAKWGGSIPPFSSDFSRGSNVFRCVSFILPRPSLEFRRRWKPPEPAAKMEVAPRWRSFSGWKVGVFPWGCSSPLWHVWKSIAIWG